MKRKLVLEMVLTIVVAGLLVLAYDVRSVESEILTVICVEPPMSEGYLGNYTTIYITVKNVIQLFAYQFNLSWSPDIVEVENESMIVEGEFLRRGGAYQTFSAVILNKTAGYALIGNTLIHPAVPANGSGNLYSITFLMKAKGGSLLKLKDTILHDKYGAHMDHITEDGYIQVIEVITEFPSFLILPLFIMATLFAVIVYKRKHPI